MKAKTEFKLGEEFQYGLVKLKCVKRIGDCSHECYFVKNQLSCNVKFIGWCLREERQDKTDVMFTEVK